MTYKVEEVSSGLCTGTLRGNAIEAKINQMASQGWKRTAFTVRGIFDY